MAAVLHKRGDLPGSTKCGCNVYKDWRTGERKVGNRAFVLFGGPKEDRYSWERKHLSRIGDLPATCKRCLNDIRRPETVTPTEDMVGKIFHRSFGYDMTINVYAKALRMTAKGVICQECTTHTNGEADYPGSTGKAQAGDVDSSKKPFLMLLRARHQYGDDWRGQGEHWSIWDGKPDYENHCD